MHHFFHRIHRHSISFVNAGRGLWWALRTQPNYQVHLTLTLISLIAAWHYNISRTEWFAIIILISVGLAIETINTAIECTNDAITLEKRDAIRLAKDVAAGAMLIFAIGAATIGLLIFVPYIF